MAIATAAIFPIPTVADRAVVRDSNGVIIPLSSLVVFSPYIAKECGTSLDYQSHLNVRKTLQHEPCKQGEDTLYLSRIQSFLKILYE